jgi:hypothetical protein
MPRSAPASPYLCFMRQASGDMPHFEVLPECSHQGALMYVARLLREHQDCDTADLWIDERVVLSVTRADLSLIEGFRKAA